MLPYAPGSYAEIRDEEWLIRRVDPSADRGCGCILFTISKGLVGVCLPRKGSRTTPKNHITTADGKTKDGNNAWNHLYKDGQFLVPDGTILEMTITDHTLRGCPRQVTRTFKAPFARANREEDYRVTWEFFETSTKK